MSQAKARTKKNAWNECEPKSVQAWFTAPTAPYPTPNLRVSLSLRAISHATTQYRRQASPVSQKIRLRATTLRDDHEQGRSQRKYKWKLAELTGQQIVRNGKALTYRPDCTDNKALAVSRLGKPVNWRPLLEHSDELTVKSRVGTKM